MSYVTGKNNGVWSPQDVTAPFCGTWRKPACFAWRLLQLFGLKGFLVVCRAPDREKEKSRAPHCSQPERCALTQLPLPVNCYTEMENPFFLKLFWHKTPRTFLKVQYLMLHIYRTRRWRKFPKIRNLEEQGVWSSSGSKVSWCQIQVIWMSNDLVVNWCVVQMILVVNWFEIQ